MSHTVLTRKRGSASSASPEMADKRGVRFVQINEPDGDDKIYVGYMKELTGNDLVPARQLFKEMFYFRPQFKMILICNRLPTIPSNDGGTWRRLCATPWESKFIDIDEEPDDSGKQFHKDHEIDDKMEQWKAAFMWLMLNKYYPIYRKSGISEPKKVKAYTEKYRQDSDVYYEFIHNFCEITDDIKNNEPVIDVYRRFKDWYHESCQKHDTPSKKDFVDYLINQNYDIRQGRIFGFRLKEINNDQMDNINSSLDLI